MREKYESLSVAVLRDLAKSRGIKGVTAMKKADIVNAMLALDEQEAANAADSTESSNTTENRSELEHRSTSSHRSESESGHRSMAQKRSASENRGTSEHRGTSVNRDDNTDEESQKRDSKLEMLAEDAKPCNGILEVMADGFGFIRCENYMPGENDVYVSPSQIRKFNLKTGDIIEGKTKKNNPNDKFGALMLMNSVNGFPLEAAQRRPNFEDMTPVFPNERIRLEQEKSSVAMRIVDLVSPIGKGQRGMIVSQPKAGKTTLLKEIAKSVTTAYPDMHLIILLIYERPEEVTDIKEAIEGKNVEVIYSTFDELPEHHKRVSEMVLGRAKRLVEHKQDVMILLDSITRLARAYNLTVPPSGRTLSGGLDPAALHMPKKFFGAARNMREGGSLTILATALVDTGSKMDDVVFEEFKGTGNMELILDRKLSEKRIFPAVDIVKSGTRRDDLLLSEDEQKALDKIYRGVNGAKKDEMVESFLNLFAHTKSNAEVVARLNNRMR